ETESDLIILNQVNTVNGGLIQELHRNIGTDTDQRQRRVSDHSHSLGLVPRTILVPVRIQTSHVIHGARSLRQRRQVNWRILRITQVSQLVLQATASEEHVRVSARIIHGLGSLEDRANKIVFASADLENVAGSSSRSEQIRRS